ncbi:MAG TPA: ATP-dependent DNA helicase RecG [Streptosporangiaceae bacterium]|jgi:ATP-dependent DNA helicase RecG|nr:ATP-dependent DNA helicase RecG [Streptosporangiaceae bacterium]
MVTLQDPLDKILGPKARKPFDEAFEIRTVGDLLRHYPRRYHHRGELTDLASLHEGEHVTVLAQVVNARTRPMGHRKGQIVEITVSDGVGTLVLTFFSARGNPWQRRLSPGTYGLFSGEVSSFRGRRQLVHPDYEPVTADEADTELAAEYAATIIPVYPATRKLPSWRIAKCAGTILDVLDAGEDPLPASVRERYGLMGLAEAIHAVHRPLDDNDWKRARKRLKWDEAFLIQTALAQRRRKAAALPAMPRPAEAGGLASAFDAALPFKLTTGQRVAGETIANDLACAHPMHRLLQGEVGSGKTIIAVRAMLQVVDAGGQAALLAPTEVLAQQHYRSVTQLLGPLGQAGRLGAAGNATRVALLTGALGAAARREALLDAASGAAGIVIGTHALLQERVQFADLGLVVVDEQHRFGVEQRDVLREKAQDGRPHVLVMTATPIPRTVAMTVYGDLDVSTLSELPAGRSPIATHVVPAADKPKYLERAWERVREEVERGQQAYVVCPRIGGDEPDGDDEPSDDLTPDQPATAGRPPLAVLDLAPALAEGPLKGLRIGVLHGRLRPEDKDQIMRDFSSGAVDVLVATTVVEVGVDVPNATTMVIMDAERFGVSQLHQLRGRVGRGTAPGLCLLVTEVPGDSKSRERLDAVAATVDGFKLSRLDLEQRREGDVLGAAQAGRKSSLRLLTLLRDEELIGQAREEATALVKADPELVHHRALATAIADLLGPDRADFLEKA